MKEGAPGVARIARVVIHDSCRIGARTTILPGVEIGPRTIVFAGSVVSRSLPPDTVCAGSPARPIGTLQSYVDSHRTARNWRRRRRFRSTSTAMSRSQRSAAPAQIAALDKGDVYILGSDASRARAATESDV